MSKAQIQMFESIMVLLMFFVFVGIGLVFFFSAAKSNLQNKATEFKTLDAIKVALVASSAPEFVYTSGDWKGATTFDMEKLRAFGSLRVLSANDYYYNYYFKLFGYANISVYQIYPYEGPQFSAMLYARSKPHWTKKQQFLMPVGLRDVVNDKTRLGILKVEVFS